VDEIQAALTGDTALLTLSHAVFKSGYLYDMASMTRAAHQAGALTLWDISHSVGAVPIDLTKAGVDLAVGCTYKYLNGGPGAPAFLFVRRELQEELNNPISGWMSSAQVFDFSLDYRPYPGLRKFLTGTPAVLSLALIEPGVDLINEAGLQVVREKSVRLSEYLIWLIDQQLVQLGFELNSPREPEQRGSHVSLSHPEGWRINQALIEEMNVIPDFRAPDNIRLGIAPLYTRYVDVFNLVERIEKVVQDGLYKKYPQQMTTVT
jgi:kynureninase